MNYVREVIIITYAPHGWGKDARPRVDVEFHKMNREFKCYEDIASYQLVRVCEALKEIHPSSTSASTDHESVTVYFRTV